MVALRVSVGLLGWDARAALLLSRDGGGCCLCSLVLLGVFRWGMLGGAYDDVSVCSWIRGPMISGLLDLGYWAWMNLRV